MVSQVVEHGFDISGPTTEKPSEMNEGQHFYDKTLGMPSWYDEGRTQFVENVMVARATYDFAVDGGAISTINLTTKLPDNAIVLDGMVDVLTTLTSATDAATIALQTEGADDIVAAIAISDGGNPWDAGLKAIIPLGTSATAVKMTAERQIKVVIAVEAVTAGKFIVLLRYVTTL